MDALVFRTGVPFGYLFFVAALAGAAVLGIALLARGLGSRPRRPGAGALGGGVVVACALVLWANIGAGAVEWNPMIHGSNALTGRWHDGRAILELASDGTYSCTGRACGELGRSGRWARKGDFYVAFVVRGGSAVQWRITERGGRYQFVAGDTQGDPDGWRPRPTFARRPTVR